MHEFLSVLVGNSSVHPFIVVSIGSKIKQAFSAAPFNICFYGPIVRFSSVSCPRDNDTDSYASLKRRNGVFRVLQYYVICGLPMSLRPL